jgi:hypothetical protein
VSRLSPKRFKGSLILLCKRRLRRRPQAPFVFGAHYYPETDFVQGLRRIRFPVLVVSGVCVHVPLFQHRTMRYRELTFAYILQVLNEFIFYFILSLTAKQLLPSDRSA